MVQNKGYNVLKTTLIPKNPNSIKPTSLQFQGPDIGNSNITVGFVRPINISKTFYDTKKNNEASLSDTILLSGEEVKLTEQLISNSSVREKIQDLLGEELFQQMSTVLSQSAKWDNSSTAMASGDVFILEYAERC